MTDIYLSTAISSIDIPAGRREIVGASVAKLAASIMKMGLRHPVTVRVKDERYVLVAGAHRIEAYKQLGLQNIPVTIVTMNNKEARLWEISENLDRAELTKLERDEQIAEWIRLTDSDALQIATHKKKGQQPGGVNAASRELGVEQTDAHRAIKVDSLSDEGKAAAREHGPDDNRSALLAAARESDPEDQVAKIMELAVKKTQPKPVPIEASNEEEDDSEIAPPEVIAENILYAIARVNENARVFNKLLKVSVLDLEAVTRINTAISRMIGKWQLVQSTLGKKG